MVNLDPQIRYLTLKCVTLGTDKLHPVKTVGEAYVWTLLNVLSLLTWLLIPLAWYEMTERLLFPFAHGVHSTNNVAAFLRHHLKFEMLDVVQNLVLGMASFISFDKW